MNPVHTIRIAVALGILVAMAAGVRADPLKLEFKTPQFTVRVVPTGPNEMASIGSYSILVYEADGTELVAGTVRERDGQLSSVWVKANDRGTSLHIWIWTTSAGSGAHGQIELLEFRDKAFHEIKLPAADPGLLKGHMGHDIFDVVDATIYWQLPIYRPNDPNANPTGGTRCLMLGPDRKEWRMTEPRVGQPAR